MVVGLVVWGGLTVMAIPVLGRFGALAANPTLLDRPYLTSWSSAPCWWSRPSWLPAPSAHGVSEV